MWVKVMRYPKRKFWLGLLLTMLLAVPGSFADTNKNPAIPGTVNYVEGEVSIGAQDLTSKSVGSAQVDPGQSLTTATGKSEMLLTPGIFLRLGDHTSAEMVSSSLTNTQVSINEGEAMLEVDELHPQNDVKIAEDGITTRIVKTGLYDFDANHNLVRVIDGKAEVQENDRNVTVKGGHQLALNTAGRLKPTSFDKKNFEATDLYRWSSLRSDYVAEANVDAARAYYVNGWYGPGWIGPGWYWDPWFAGYTFIPGDGIFYNPFGWGFYSPFWAYRSPLFVRSGGYYGYHGAPPVRIAHDPAPYHNRAIHSSGFAGGRGGFAGGGPSASGFHGGTMGAGFHGGAGFGGGFAGHR
jgi:hypothetical protein